LIRADVQRALVQRRQAQYTDMVRDLPALIDESVQAVHTSSGEEQRLAYECLAGTFRCVFTVAWNFGYIDLATVALDRLAWTAPRADDPGSAAMHSYLRAQTTMSSGWCNCRASPVGRLTSRQDPRDRANGPEAWPTLTRSVDVPHCIVRIFEPLLRLVLPGRAAIAAPISHPPASVWRLRSRVGPAHRLPRYCEVRRSGWFARTWSRTSAGSNSADGHGDTWCGWPYVASTSMPGWSAEWRYGHGEPGGSAASAAL
jgi:hypothetical protein